MIEGVDKSPIGHLDLGFDRDERVKPCAKWAWCTEHDGHRGCCMEVPRAPYPEADFGPKRKR